MEAGANKNHMVRFFNVYYPSRTFVLFCSEIILTVLTFVAAALLLQARGSSARIWTAAGMAQLVVMALTCLCSVHYFDLYDSRTFRSKRELVSRLLQVLGVASFALGIIYYLVPKLIVMPGLYFLASPMLLCLLFGLRMEFVFVNDASAQSQRVILVGWSQLGCDLTREIRLRPELGINLVGFVDDNDPPLSLPIAIPRLGSTCDLEKIVAEGRIEAAIVAVQDRRGRLPMDALLKLRIEGMQVHEARTAYERITGKIPVEDLRPSWLIFSEGFRTHARMTTLQRAYSCAAAFVGLLLVLPLMLLIALVVKLSSKGPVLFKQERVGKGGSIFPLYKFRSMRVDAEARSGPVWTVDNDPRITRVGMFLRKTHLDELPQLWNVLRGDMNIVGPRPERPEFMQLLETEVPYYAHRHIVRPGITGWAQVRYNYGSTVEEQYEKLRHDLFYIKNVSPSLDFLILFETVKIVLWRRGSK
jgi:sugar transferase (PEP-CTERM system associated)